MRVYKESGREGKVEAEKNCWPVDCVELQYVLTYHLQHKFFTCGIPLVLCLTCTVGGQDVSGPG